MINKDIFEGLKLALLKKETLKKAMMSFYNAGYKKEDIENAAKALLREEQLKRMQTQQKLQSAQSQLPSVQTKKIPEKKLPSTKKIPEEKKTTEVVKEIIKSPQKKIVEKIQEIGDKKELSIQKEINKEETKKNIPTSPVPSPTSKKRLPIVKTPKKEINTLPPIPPKTFFNKQESPQKNEIKQNVSEYEAEKPKGKGLIFLLIFVLLFSIGVLTGVIFFKKELAELLRHFLG